jgi:hypothetical protein
MATLLTRFRAAFPAGVIGVVLMIGCADAPTRDDVADARTVLQREQEETAEMIREGEEQIAQARRDAHEASEPVVRQGREDVAAVERKVAQSIREQQKDEDAAAGKLQTAEQKLRARQARDAYVKRVEHELAEIELEINQSEERAANVEGNKKDDLDQQIDTLQARHELAEKALQELRNAELDDWEVHQQHVRIALQDLDSNLNSIR